MPAFHITMLEKETTLNKVLQYNSDLNDSFSEAYFGHCHTFNEEAFSKN